MNIKNFVTLTIRARDLNLVFQEPELMKQLRKLTIHSYSGMNRELNYLTKLASTRKIDAKALLAYRSGQLVAWALFSKEKSAMTFSNTWDHFHPTDGVLFEVFVDPQFRRQGIATELLKVARRKAGATRLCIAPWDKQSRGFYSQFPNYKMKVL